MLKTALEGIWYLRNGSGNMVNLFYILTACFPVKRVSASQSFVKVFSVLKQLKHNYICWYTFITNVNIKILSL